MAAFFNCHHQMRKASWRWMCSLLMVVLLLCPPPLWTKPKENSLDKLSKSVDPVIENHLKWQNYTIPPEEPSFQLWNNLPPMLYKEQKIRNRDSFYLFTGRSFHFEMEF